ncbi:MAG: hypothetical protein JWP48_4125 [Actinoallomurus sp.]|nr:hypothetical protein [Actinoallomurus sp.]
MTRGRAAPSDPFDISAVNSSDELVDALSSRRLAEAGHPDDPAVALLAALVADVDAGAPPMASPSPFTRGIPATYRRGVRAFVTFGVAAVVLTSAGAAAAGGGEGVDAIGSAQGTARPKSSERSNENAQRHDPVTGTAVVARRRAVEKRRSAPVVEDAVRAPEDQQEWGHRGHRPSHGSTRTPDGLHHSWRPDEHSSAYRWKPVAVPEHTPPAP